MRSTRPWRVLPVLVVWFAALAGLYWYFFLSPRQWFDPAAQQPPALARPDAQQQLRQSLDTLLAPPRGQPWLVRVRQSSCACERFVEQYHAALAGRPGLPVRVATLEAAQLPPAVRQQWRQWLPSTPAVLLFDAGGNLVYAGPYHQDGVCNAGNSFIEPVLANLAASPAGEPVINTLAFGCFCPL